MCPFQLYHLLSLTTESKLGYVTLSYLTYAGAVVWPIRSGKLLAAQCLVASTKKGRRVNMKLPYI